jgi:hypothetical protein
LEIDNMGSSIPRSLAMLIGAGWLLAGIAHAEGAAEVATAADADVTSQVGTWVHNPRESINMPDPDEAQTVEIRRYDTVLDYTWTGVAKDGKTSTFSYSMAADGVVRPLPGDEGLRGSMRRTPSGVIEAKLFFPDGASDETHVLRHLRRQCRQDLSLQADLRQALNHRSGAADPGDGRAPCETQAARTTAPRGDLP